MKRKYPPLSLDSFIPFGKYARKKTVRELMTSDPAYLQWLVENTDVEINYEEEDYEDELDVYITNHPNPFGLNYSALSIAIKTNMSKIYKRGNPAIDDWDDIVYSKEEHLNRTQANRHLYGSV